jgi:hypothetical protein
MKEAREGSAVLDDVDDETFARFAYFAFAKSYPDPSPEGNIKPRERHICSRFSAGALEADAKPILVGRNLSILSLLARAKFLDDFMDRDRSAEALLLSQHQNLRNHDHAIAAAGQKAMWRVSDYTSINWEMIWYIQLFLNTYGVEESTFEEELAASVDEEGEPGRRYSDMCIPHVKVWIFANRYLVGSLLAYTETWLVRILANWVIVKNDIIDDLGLLIQFTYENTMAGSWLRTTLARFTACILSQISELDGWENVIDDIPQFAADLVRVLTTPRPPYLASKKRHELAWDEARRRE